MNSPLLSTPVPHWQTRVARAFSRAAPRYDALASAQRDIGEALWQTLPKSAQQVLDLGCGTGYWTQRLATRYPEAAITGLDLAPGMLAYAQATYGEAIRWQLGDAAALPQNDASVELVFSNLAIQWCPSIEDVMQELARVLAPGGQARITTLLPGTLHEVATAWQRPEALLQTPDASTVQRAIARSGLRLTHHVCEQRRFFYPDLNAVMASIKGVGAQVARPNAQLTRQALTDARLRYETLRTLRGLPVSYHCLTLCLESAK
ncbi:methyltransferase domain-containing protein [Vreelandella hamiltonii]|uniref:Malonyl-[acyl-carrier protein] O-methyltransferase n=1 Tax=Vreelandella hamiltonii TaxID=502829 RepID=A0A8H9MAT8_9GAMM|nr:methyltransferase domain-containing protein [Halomonas hamiltonii]GHD55224.1 malonyl-[acyl-carrier protein] O-methyltransferase [Halomonas hamiltonii]